MILMLVIGITNKLPHNKRLFMWELDNTEEYYAYEKARYLSQIADIDIYLLESSQEHYHLVSFDVLDLLTVDQIQNLATEESGDYLTIRELPLFDDKGLWNTLRLGMKGDKNNPKYLTVFYSRNREIKPKSLQHFLLYHSFCGIPFETEPRKSQFFNLGSVLIAVYETGIGAKKKFKPIFSGHFRISSKNSKKWHK